MGLLLAASEICIPQFIRKRKLEMLFKATADAFQVTVPSTKELSFEECLKLYAQFTREQAHKAIQRGNAIEIRYRLYQSSYRIGQQFRTGFHINTTEEVMRMSTVIYKMLKITFHGQPQGDIVIKRCFFSDYYSGDVCRLVSSLDEGLLSGLSGGGKLRFSQRITEGNECCWAYLETVGGLK